VFEVICWRFFYLEIIDKHNINLNFLKMKTKEILKLIKDAKAEILALEISNPKGLFDAELIKKVQQVKYKLGHTLTKEDMM
jgi:hypothetical protein